MKKLHFISLLVSITLFFGFSHTIIAQDLPEGISAAFKTGNAKELSKYFNTNVDLTLLEKQDIYSKSQAELILKDFFSKNQPSGFTVLHQGGKEGSKYVIGNLVTSKGTYRISLLLKNQNNTQVIQQLRIETGNE